MARTAIAPQTLADNGGAAITFVAADAANGMTFANDGKTELVVLNGSGSSRVVTAHSVACSHGRTGDVVLTLTAGQQGAIPKLDPALFNQPGTGLVNVDFDVATSVTVAAVKRA